MLSNNTPKVSWFATQKNALTSPITAAENGEGQQRQQRRFRITAAAATTKEMR